MKPSHNIPLILILAFLFNLTLKVSFIAVALNVPIICADQSFFFPLNIIVNIRVNMR